MPDETNMGKWLVMAGLMLVVMGLLVMVGSRVGLGRLPGDIRYESGGTRIYFPITTMILLSVLLSLVLWIIGRFRQ
jgi:hypothetical protein